MEPDPRSWLAALRNSHDRLSALVGPLVPDGVEAPSLAREWSIAQVLSHLGSQAEIFDAILEAAVAGDDLPGPEAFPPVWDAWNSRTPVEQVVDSVAANGAFQAKVEALSDEQLAALRFALFGMDLDVVGFLRMRLSEHAVHSWDVAGALDAKARVAPDAVDLLIDTLPEMAARVGKPQGVARRIRVVTEDPARDLVLVVDDAVRVEAWDDGPVDGVLRLPAEAWLRLVYGRLDEEHTPTVEIDGDGLTLDTLRSVFPGF
jgi:uncharacterized protein (TIGR03083 family)